MAPLPHIFNVKIKYLWVASLYYPLSMKALLLVSQDKARVSYLHAGLAQGDVGGDWHLQVPHTWVSCAPLASYQMNKINKINKIKKKNALAAKIR